MHRSRGKVSPECDAHSTFSLKQAFAVKSFLATQGLENSELWLWLAGQSSYSAHEENRLLRPPLPFLQVKRFDFEVESRDTPLHNYWDAPEDPNFYFGIFNEELDTILADKLGIETHTPAR